MVKYYKDELSHVFYTPADSNRREILELIAKSPRKASDLAKRFEMDLRPGGIYHYCLVSSDGKEMWGRFVYREIVAPKRMVFVNSFSNEKGELTRYPMHVNHIW